MNELQVFNNGDTNYIQKHNANYANLKAAIEALENNLAAQVAAASGPGSAFDALFGPTAAIIGADSYAMTGSGDVLNVAPGFNWKPSIPMVVRNPAPTTLSFTGLAAGTYYVYADKTGTPVRSATAGVEDIYSIAWTGSTFGAITRLAPIVWGAADDFAAQVSAALGQTFTTLDARLEAGEAAAAGGALARAWQIGKLDKDVSGSTDVTLSAAEANNMVINLTGALTADIDVILPVGASSRLWAVTNNTIGAYTVTMKGALGAGAVVAQGSKALFGQDGTNVFALGLSQQTIIDAITAHEAEADPHPQYLTQTEADGRYASSTAATGVSSVNGHTGAVTLAASDVGAVASSALGAANGAASLDDGGKLPASQLPNLAIIDFLGTVANQAAMLALSGQKGDWCARSDTSTVYVITGSDPTQVSSWTALSYPTGAGGTVTSVALTTPGLLFNVTGSPVTGAGTLAMTLKTQAKNTVLAGPATGADAVPTMRPLVQADLPAQPLIPVPFYPGVPAASALMLMFPAPAGTGTLTFAAALAGSSGKALVAATAQTDFDVRKNATSPSSGTSVGTMRFAAGATVPSFIAASGFTLDGGTEWLTMWAPATPDATLANIAASLYCTRS
jgi:hypothetical protein